MRLSLALFSVLALGAVAAPAQAFPQFALPNILPAFRSDLQQVRPPGSYERQCSSIRVEGQFLHAVCRNANGRPATSSLNILSCVGDIGVDAQGGLVCSALTSPQPLPGRPARPERDTVVLYPERGMRGPPTRIARPTPNLVGTGLNDRIVSIALERRAGPWIVCEDANYAGRCVTIKRSVKDVRTIGMAGAISSLRPAR